MGYLQIFKVPLHILSPWLMIFPTRMSKGLLIKGLPGGSVGKESACNVQNLGSIPGLGRSPGDGKSYPLQYSGLENSVDCIVHGVAKSRTRLRDFHFHFGRAGRREGELDGEVGGALRCSRHRRSLLFPRDFPEPSWSLCQWS